MRSLCSVILYLKTFLDSKKHFLKKLKKYNTTHRIYFYRFLYYLDLKGKYTINTLQLYLISGLPMIQIMSQFFNKIDIEH